MPATVSVTTQFTFDRKVQRYRRGGRFVSDRAVKLGVKRVIRNASAEIRDLTAQMTAGKLTVADWQSRMSSEVKNLHIAAAVAGRGGLAQMASTDYLRVGRELKFQYGRLRAFAAQVKAGEINRKQTLARAELYVAAMNATYEGTRRAAAMAAGFDQERNVLANIPEERHCVTGKRPGCVEQTAAGWVAIGSLVPIGSRCCIANCLCSWSFRRHSPTAKLFGTLPQ